MHMSMRMNTNASLSLYIYIYVCMELASNHIHTKGRCLHVPMCTYIYTYLNVFVHTGKTQLCLEAPCHVKRNPKTCQYKIDLNLKFQGLQLFKNEFR